MTINTLRSRTAQEGGITILVALALLVLLTVSAVGMSRNSFREIVTSGFARQGAMSRNVADAGIEWSIYWMDMGNAASAGGTAQRFPALQLQLLRDQSQAGVAKDLMTGATYSPGGELQDAMRLPAPSGVVQGFTIGLTRMGKLPMTNTSQGVGSGAFTPAAGTMNRLAPDLWAVRSDAQVQQGLTFVHAREAWISTPVR